MSEPKWTEICRWCPGSEARQCADPVCRGRGAGEQHDPLCPAIPPGQFEQCTCEREVAA